MRKLAPNLAVAGLLLCLASCVTNSGVAPPITADAIQKAAQRGVSAAALAAGRRLLTTRCVSCHTLEPVTDYSSAEWNRIVDEMAPRSKLKDSEELALREYLLVMSGPLAR